ncbi:hypothetical protein [Tenuifilum osseticum]|uniref:hypothetical protein n=1 Tax=Tenuifilum osseticum TaxID=3374723 RepID=UPI0034E5F066
MNAEQPRYPLPRGNTPRNDKLRASVLGNGDIPNIYGDARYFNTKGGVSRLHCKREAFQSAILGNPNKRDMGVTWHIYSTATILQVLPKLPYRL